MDDFSKYHRLAERRPDHGRVPLSTQLLVAALLFALAALAVLTALVALPLLLELSSLDAAP